MASVGCYSSRFVAARLALLARFALLSRTVRACFRCASPAYEWEQQAALIGFWLDGARAQLRTAVGSLRQFFCGTIVPARDLGCSLASRVACALNAASSPLASCKALEAKHHAAAKLANRPRPDKDDHHNMRLRRPTGPRRVALS